MKNKIRILITHQIHYLTQSNKIILLEDRTIKSSGSFADLATQGLNINQMFQEYEIEKRKDSLISNQSRTENTFGRQDSIISTKSRNRSDSIISNVSIGYEPNIIAAVSDVDAMSFHNYNTKEDYLSQMSFEAENKNHLESQKHGTLSNKTYLTYFKSAVGILGTVFFFIVLISGQILRAVTDYWINRWAAIESMDYNNKTNIECIHNCTMVVVPVFEDRQWFFIIYIILNFITYIVIGTSACFFYYICFNTSKVLHNQMFISVMKSSVRFFDLNPLGRILNRFSKDIGAVDETIPPTFFDFLYAGTRILITITLTISINYWILVVLIPLGFFLAYERKYFLKSSVEIKRIEGISINNLLMKIS